MTNTKTIGADWKFVSEQMKIAASPFLKPIDRLSAGALGVGLGILALPKTLIGLSSVGGFAQAEIWYDVSNIGVTNRPSKR